MNDQQGNPASLQRVAKNEEAKPPPLPLMLRKTRLIQVRLSGEEFVAITAMGKPIGGISALVRKQVFGKGVSPIKKEAVRELARIGVSLNLIARQVTNCQQIETVEIVAILLAIDRDVGEIVQRLLKP
jgi:hypothetical protein